LLQNAIYIASVIPTVLVPLAGMFKLLWLSSGTAVLRSTVSSILNLSILGMILYGGRVPSIHLSPPLIITSTVSQAVATDGRIGSLLYLFLQMHVGLWIVILE
jgi:hypothetical protein